MGKCVAHPSRTPKKSPKNPGPQTPIIQHWTNTLKIRCCNPCITSKNRVMKKGTVDHDYSLKRHVSIFEKDDPRSLINILPKRISEAVEKLPEALLLEDLGSLRRKVRPDSMLNMLRYSFWREYDFAQDNLLDMDISRVTAGICDASLFYHRVVKSELILAWVMHPPSEYMLMMEESLMVGVERLREILDAPVLDENSRLNAKNAELILKTVMFLDMRVNGAIVQKHEIQQKNLNLNLNGAARDVKQYMNIANMEQLEYKIKEIEHQIKLAEKRGARNMVIDTEGASRAALPVKEE